MDAWISGTGVVVLLALLEAVAFVWGGYKTIDRVRQLEKRVDELEEVL